MSKLAAAAKEVFETMEARPEAPSSRREAAMRKLAGFSAMAAKVHSEIRGRLAASDREAEWQRVHSYIADVLKDTHVLYAKLARLEGDFAGEELSRLERISEAVLTLGNELSEFSKAFYEGKKQAALWFARNVLPKVEAEAKLMRQEDASALDIPDAGFSAG